MNERLHKNGEALVSIIIPVYNGSNYLSQAINSALSQTYENIEVIVVNDGSTDNGATAEIAKAYGDKIRYYEKSNGGVSTALNFGIEKMNGEYFSWLSHDDMYTPIKIQSQMKKILEVGNCVVGCNVMVVGSDGAVLRKNVLSVRKQLSTKCFLALDSETGLNGCSLLIPKKYFEDCGTFNAELKCTQDYDMWFRIAEKYSFEYVEDFGVLSRQHEAQDSRNKTELCTQEADRLHSDFLKKISQKEIKQFLDGDKEYLYKQYHIYRNAGYLKTACQIFKHLWLLEDSGEKKSSKLTMLLGEITGFDVNSLELNQIRDVLLKDKKSKKRTVLFYSNVWRRGGIERVLSILFPYFLDEYNVVLVSNYTECEDGFSLPQEVIHLKISNNLEEKLPYSLLVLATLCNTDIFVGNPNIICSFLDVYQLMEESGIKTIASTHGYYFIPYWSKWLYPVAAKWKEAYPNASVVTWLTSFSALLGKQLNDNSIVMPNPNTFSIQDRCVKVNTEKSILVVGRFYDAIKRVDLVLKVFREIVRQEKDAKLYLVGEYDLDMHVPVDSPYSVKELIRYLDFPDEKSIIWVGEVDDLVPYYQKASVLMLTSDNEGFSMVLNEAGVFGVPRVLFKIPGLEDIVTHGEDGYIVPRDNIKMMSEYIIHLLTNETSYQRMSIAAQNHAANFDASIIADKWKGLFACLLDKPEILQDYLEEKFGNKKVQSLSELKEIVNYYQDQIREVMGGTCEGIPVSIFPQKEYFESSQNAQSNVINPCTNCREIIYQSNSWRITKPLRWGALTIKSLKNDGIIITMKKIKRRFELKFSKEK